MTSQTILVVGNTVIMPWGRDQIRRLSEQARNRGLRIIGADTKENLARASADELSRVDEVVCLDVHDAEACRSWAAGRSDIDAILTIRELAVYSTAVMARELGLPGNDPEAVHRIRNKDLCRRRLVEAGLPQPRTAVCGSAADAEAFMAQTGPGPWIVKPRDGLASIGVTKIDSVSELPAALDRLGTPPSAMGNLSGAGGFLLETFVQGEEYSAEGVMVGGVPHVLAVTRKETMPGFVEMGHHVPAGIDSSTAAEAGAAVSAALLAVGVTRGIFHVEFWVTDHGVVLGELHDRPGGDYIHALVEATRPGLELYGKLIDDLLDRPQRPLPASRGSATTTFLNAAPGRLTAVRGWKELQDTPGVLAADLEVSVGDEIERVTDCFGRHAVFAVRAPEPAGAAGLAARLRESVVFETE
ncbi:ATP-grasp domain-containing protein [Streptomyces odontomachi]|uniref:ATP-grasp domain-containing protein n=1 Tax=Streptomyces odontomachi TaxID=2944940 RepID=UPI002109DD0B|nr:ATP-grasp domain-containing protein [Streptomyces sp. ODS25]